MNYESMSLTPVSMDGELYLGSQKVNGFGGRFSNDGNGVSEARLLWGNVERPEWCVFFRLTR